MACYETPIVSKVLSTSWSEPEDIRFPLLMPGGRWLIAVCDDGRSFNSTISLWDIDSGALNWLPEVQILAEGRVLSLDMKMDQTGVFAVLAVLCEKEEYVYHIISLLNSHQCIFKKFQVSRRAGLLAPSGCLPSCFQD